MELYNYPESGSTEKQCCINTCESSTFLIIVFIPPQYDAVVIFFMADENKRKFSYQAPQLKSKLPLTTPENHYSKTTFGQYCMPSFMVQPAIMKEKKDRVDF